MHKSRDKPTAKCFSKKTKSRKGNIIYGKIQKQIHTC